MSSVKAKLAAIQKRLDAKVAEKSLAEKYGRGEGKVIAEIEHLAKLFEEARLTGIEPPEWTAMMDEKGGRCRRWMENAMPGIIAAVERDMRAEAQAQGATQ
jgi:hypothetical protein